MGPLIKNTNEQFKGVAEVAALQNTDLQVLALDTVDISPALDRLRARLKVDARLQGVKGDVPEVPSTQRRNPERTSVCSFAMTSKIIKSLGTAQAIYRNLTSGFFMIFIIIVLSNLSCGDLPTTATMSLGSICTGERVQ